MGRKTEELKSPLKTANKKTFDSNKLEAAIGRIKHAFKGRKHKSDNPTDSVVSLHPDGPSRGRVLISYIIDGFLIEDKSQIPNTHTNIWQTIIMAQTFLDLGFEVDVIHFSNQRFFPQKEYTYFFDVRHNMARLSPALGSDCVKIMHLDTANILFHNAAESNRLLNLQKRRGKICISAGAFNPCRQNLSVGNGNPVGQRRPSMFRRIRLLPGFSC